MTLIFLLLSTWTVVVVAFASASTSQRDALIDLWRANLGAQWSGASGWLSNATHCSWQGVQCSADNNSVASLSLASFGLVALQLPATFGALSDLQALDASANAIAELQMDESIAQFASLQFLSLTDNALTAMPAAAIARLPSLQMLLLGANRIAAVSAASFGNRSLPMLTLLDLHENAIAHFDAAVLPLLPALATLSLSDNRVLTAFPFANHSSLAQLSLDGNRLASIDGVEWFAQLTALSVDSNALTRLPTRLPVNLTELHATNNKLSALDDAICACGALKVLDVANNDVAALPACLASLVDIYGLLLARNSLTALPDGLSALGKLDTLDVQGNRLRALPDDLLASRNSTSLTHLLLAENALVDFNVSGSFPRLVQLDISFNPLITRVPDGVDLAHMPVLLELDAQHCSIARLPPATTLASLAIVDLAGNRVASPPANASASAAADALCGPLAPRPALLCQLSIVRLSNNRLTDVPDLSCCAKLATLLVDGNRLDRLPPWVGALPALASFAAGALLTDAALVPLRALRRRLDLLDLSGNRLAFPPPFLFQIADQLLLAGNQIREIDFLAFPDFYFNGTRWIDLSNNQLRALPPFYTIASGPVKPLTLRTLFAHNNLISGRVPFIPVDTLTLSGNPLMRVPGDRLNSLPLAANAGSTFFQLLSLDEPHVFSGSALTCKTIYRDRQVVSVTGAPSDVWQVLATVPLALDASYFDYRHCRCRATYYGFVGTAGDASCVPCASAFLPFRAARCDDGGNTLLFTSNHAPLFACDERANDTVELVVRRMYEGGAGCALVAFEACGGADCMRNGSAPVVSRGALGTDALSGELCAEGHTGRLCAACAVGDADRVFYRAHHAACDLCPDLPIGTMLGVTVAGVAAIVLLFVALPRSMRRLWPLAATLVLAALAATMYVGELHAVVFGDILWFSMSLTFMLLLGERRNRIDTANRLARKPGADKKDHGNAGLKVMLFYVQTVAAVASQSFPRTAASASSLTFAKPGAIGVACLLRYVDQRYLQYEPAVRLAVGLSVPFVIGIGCFVALAARDGVDRARARAAARRRVALDERADEDDSGVDDGNDNDAVPAPVVAQPKTKQSLWARAVDAAVGPLLGPGDSLAANDEPLATKCKRVAIGLLHVAFFGALKSVVGVVACGSGRRATQLLPQTSLASTLKFMHEEPAIVCNTDLPLYAAMLAIAGAFAVVYVLVFPALLVFVMWRHRALLRANAVMLSPLQSAAVLPAADDGGAAQPPSPRAEPEPKAWYAKLMHGWSHSQPFAELFWLARRVAIALVLALLARGDVTQGVLLTLVLGGSLFLQRTIKLFEERLDQQLDTMALWAILVTFVYATLETESQTNEWSALAVCVLVLDGCVLLATVLAVMRREWAQKLSDRMRSSIALARHH